MTKKDDKKVDIENKLKTFFEDNYLDVQGLSPNINALDEAYLARVLTKLAISAATIWWSVLEIKDFVILRRKSKING